MKEQLSASAGTGVVLLLASIVAVSSARGQNCLGAYGPYEVSNPGVSHPGGMDCSWYQLDIFVADTGNDRIQAWGPGYPDPVLATTWGATGSGPGEFRGPTDVAVGPGTTPPEIFVVDSGNARIQVFDFSGAFLRSWGVSGSGPGQFMEPNSIAVDDSAVYVTDSGNHRVQRFLHSGEFRASWGGPGVQDGQFQNPAGIAVGQGQVFVVDQDLGRVQVFTPDGAFVRTFGSTGPGDGQLNKPTGIRAYPLVIADTGNNRLVLPGEGGTWHCTVTGSAYTDFCGPLGWTYYALDGPNSRILTFWIPDLVVPTTWGAIKARIGG